MYTCADCNILACDAGTSDKMPKNCPMRQEEFMKQAVSKYADLENHDFYITSSCLEKDGYCQWPRIKETIEFCRRMQYKKIGMGFCKGLRKEARVIAGLFRKEGFEMVSVICKTGGVPKEEAGIPKESKLHPEEFEAMCNPIAQASFLNEQHTEFNLAVGLCVGHDSLFYKYSNAPVTTLIAKDRVLAHNPCGAIYCADVYFKDRLS